MDNAALADIIAQAVKIATAPLHARIMALERQKSVQPERGEAGPKGERGEAGQPGRDADPAAVAALHREIDALKSMVTVLTSDRPPVDLETLVTKAAALVKPGRDGRDATVDLDAIAVKAAALMPRPENGKDAPPVDVESVVLKVLALMPVPKDGKDAPAPDLDAIAVKAAALMPAPVNGKDGRDGLGIVGAVINQDGRLLVTFSDGTTKDVGRVQIEKSEVADLVKGELQTWPKPVDGKDGKDGKDGLDGLGFDDMEVVFDATKKAVVHRFTKGDRVVDKVAPSSMIHVGIYSDSETYQNGHCVTRGGSVWSCLTNGIKGIRPDDKTPEGQRHWLLIVQRGREGKQGQQGRPGPAGQDLRWDGNGNG